MNTSLLHQKPFLEYDRQIEYLKSKGLQISNSEYAISILQKISYYSLINGYKDIFKNQQTHDFINGTTFENIYTLYLFDADLREFFLKYILIVEANIKSSISYHFTKLYGNGIAYYQDKFNYDYGNNEKDIKKLFYKMDCKIHGKFRSPQVSYYMNTYHDVPLWVLNTDLTLGEIATMYRYLKGHCKTQVCNDFHHMKRNELGKMLIVLTKFRNICAHGNRLFNFHIQDAILDSIVHKELHIPQKAGMYQYGKNDLFSAVISLKHILSKEDFQAFFCSLKDTLLKYKPNAAILLAMGFPENWSSILKIQIHES